MTSTDANASDLKISAVEAYRLRLPYKNAISFASVKQEVGEFVLLRIVLNNGLDGIAESVCRPEHSGESAASVAFELQNFFAPLMVGADPLGHLTLLDKLNKIKGCTAAKALIDLALWDIRGKVFEQPVWRLLGGAKPKPTYSPGGGGGG